jgi:hypothetical protein
VVGLVVGFVVGAKQMIWLVWTIIMSGQQQRQYELAWDANSEQKRNAGKAIRSSLYIFIW